MLAGPSFSSLPAQAAGGADEYTLKAVLFLKLTHFVYWPDKEARGGQRVLCVVGPDPFGDNLTSAAAAVSPPRSVQERASAGEWAGCDQVFIGRNVTTPLPELVSRLTGQGVLTVSDIPGFAAAGGMVELSLEGSRVGVVINRAAARARSLDFNAQLLSLARLVGG